MNSFDEVYLEDGVECPCGLTVHHFKTFSLDNMLDNYTVNKDGVLEVENYTMVENREPMVNQFDFPIYNKDIKGFSVLNVTKNIEMTNACKKGKHWITVHLGYIQGQLISKKVKISDYED